MPDMQQAAVDNRVASVLLPEPTIAAISSTILCHTHSTVQYHAQYIYLVAAGLQQEKNPQAHAPMTAISLVHCDYPMSPQWATCNPRLTFCAVLCYAVRAALHCAGAMLLAAPWGDVGIILQMQRGNLEGISPRLLVLAAVCDALDCHHYARAWDLAITHRVDLNLIVDYAWPSFVAHAAEFVAAVADPLDLCDLLLALKPGSVLLQGGVYSSLAETLSWQQQQQQQRPDPATAAVEGLAALTLGQSSSTIPGSAAGTAAAAPAGSGSGTVDSSSSSSKVPAVCVAVRKAVLQLPGRYLKGHLKTVVMSYARSVAGATFELCTVLELQNLSRMAVPHVSTLAFGCNYACHLLVPA